jgi:hypothetical protein
VWFAIGSGSTHRDHVVEASVDVHSYCANGATDGQKRKIVLDFPFWPSIGEGTFEKITGDRLVFTGNVDILGKKSQLKIDIALGDENHASGRVECFGGMDVTSYEQTSGANTQGKKVDKLLAKANGDNWMTICRVEDGKETEVSIQFVDGGDHGRHQVTVHLANP